GGAVPLRLGDPRLVEPQHDAVFVQAGEHVPVHEGGRVAEHGAPLGAAAGGDDALERGGQLRRRLLPGHRRPPPQPPPRARVKAVAAARPPRYARRRRIPRWRRPPSPPAASGAWRKRSVTCRGWSRPPSATRAAISRTRPTTTSAPAAPATPSACRWST